jgi:hypothetical protein
VELALDDVVAAGCCAVLSVMGTVAVLESWPAGANGGADTTIGCGAVATTMVVIGTSTALRNCLRGAGGFADVAPTTGVMESPAGTGRLVEAIWIAEGGDRLIEVGIEVPAG